MSDKMEMQIEKLGHELFALVDNSNDALAELEKDQPDLILMDVRIEGDYDGIELAEMILKKWDIPILFITSNHDDSTFRRVSRISPEGMITKPFTDIQLQRSIELIFTKKKKEKETETSPDVSWSSGEDVIFIKSMGKLNKVNINDIFYLEADGRYVQVHLIDKKYLVRISMKDFVQKLNPKQFMQTHRQFVVNVKKIKSIDLENSVVILESMHIPVSRREKDNLLNGLDWL